MIGVTSAMCGCCKVFPNELGGLQAWLSEDERGFWPADHVGDSIDGAEVFAVKADTNAFTGNLTLPMLANNLSLMMSTPNKTVHYKGTI
jgi:hypothetical protein